ncbi:MAG: hypothetical protein R6W87_02650 [Halospina sp.]
MASPLLNSRVERIKEQARRDHLRNQLVSSFKHDSEQNNVTVFVLSPEEVVELWLAKHRRNGKSDEEINARFQELVGDETANLVRAQAASVAGLARDGKNFGALMRDFKRSGNVLGEYRIALHRGKKYIIFKGNHKLRNIIKGTRYTYRSPRVLKMGIGAWGATSILKGNVAITLIVSPIVNGFAWIFDPKFGWDDFLTNVPSDVVKASLAGIVGTLVAGTAYLVGTTVAFPLGLGIVVSFIVGFALSALDMEGELTDSVINATVETYGRVYSAVSGAYTESVRSAKRHKSNLVESLEHVYYHLFDDEIGSCKVQAPESSAAQELQWRVRRIERNKAQLRN